MSRNLYRFLKLGWSLAVAGVIRNQTHATSAAGGTLPQDRGAYGVQRADSRLAANGWRHRLSWQDAVAIQAECGDVMRLLGYRPFSTPRELADVSFPSVGPCPLPALLNKEASGDS